MRCEGPAAQAALVLACQSGMPGACDGRIRRCSRHRSAASECLGLVTVGCHAAGFVLTWQERPPGRVRSKPIKHRARDAWVWRTCGLPCRSPEPGRDGEAKRTSTSLDVARRRGPWVRPGPLASRAPSVLFAGDADLDNAGGPRRLGKNPGAERWLASHLRCLTFAREISLRV